MSCYSLDFRQQVLKSFKVKRKNLGTKNKGSLKKSIQYIKNAYNISRGTLFNWLKKEKDNNLKPKKREIKKPYKIDIEKLDLLDEDSRENYTLKELSTILNVSTSGIHKHFVKNRITFKKKNFGITKVINN